MGKHLEKSPKRLNNKINRSLSAVAAVGFILSATTGSAIAAPGLEDTPELERSTSIAQLESKVESKPVSILAPAVTAPVTASPTAKISFSRTPVKTEAAPPKEAPKPVEVKLAEPVVVETAPAPAPEMNITTPAVINAVASAPAVAPAPAPAAPVASNGSKGATIAAAALAQLGKNQDCTMLVTNSLRSVGINFHDWPAGYLGLGTVVSASEAQAGDLLYYVDGGGGMAHIAVYLGGGQAVHGGFNGNSTVQFSANVGSGPVYIRVH